MNVAPTVRRFLAKKSTDQVQFLTVVSTCASLDDLAYERLRGVLCRGLGVRLATLDRAVCRARGTNLNG